MKLFAHAKLNLLLNVVGRRADGYHLLSMFNVPLALADQLEIQVTDAPGVKLEQVLIEPESMQPGTAANPEKILEVLKSPEKNLVVRAAEVFLKHFGIAESKSGREDIPGRGVSIGLTKRIPSGAGLGGGSSDAAAVLRGLRAIFLAEMDPNESAKQVIDIALALGTDIPFFLQHGAALVSGIGELVIPLEDEIQEKLNQYPVILVIPDIEMPTPNVYAKFRELTPEVPSNLSRSEIEPIIKNQKFAVKNELEESILALNSELHEILHTLRSIESAQVSFTGSGSALFLLPDQASMGAEILAQTQLALRRVKVPCRAFLQKIVTD